MPVPRSLRDKLALFISVLLFLAVMGSVFACGDEDLFFPGEIPPTAASTATATGPTATPDNDDDIL